MKLRSNFGVGQGASRCLKIGLTCVAASIFGQSSELSPSGGLHIAGHEMKQVVECLDGADSVRAVLAATACMERRMASVCENVREADHKMRETGGGTGSGLPESVMLDCAAAREAFAAGTVDGIGRGRRAIERLSEMLLAIAARARDDGGTSLDEPNGSVLGGRPSTSDSDAP